MILVPRIEHISASEFIDLVRSHSYDRDFTQREFGCEAFIVAGLSDLDAWVHFFSHDRQGRARGLLELGFPL